MKFLIVQENGRHEKNKHMRECFSLQHALQKLGHEAVCWGQGHDSYEKNKSVYLDSDIDILFCLENYNNGWLPDDLNESKATKVFWSIDSHCALNEHQAFCAKFKPQLVLSSTAKYLPEYTGLTEKATWFPNAVDVRHFKKSEEQKTDEIVFVASMIEGREIVSNLLKKTVDLKTYSGLLGEEYIRKLQTSYASFNQSIADDINYRVFESKACGAPLITNNLPDLDKLFVLDEDIAVYSSTKEMIGMCQWLKKDTLAAKQLAENGYKRTIENHTYGNRAKLLLEILSRV